MRASSAPGPRGLAARATSFFRRLEPRSAAALGLVLVLVAAAIDYATGEEFGPLIFYVVPVAIVATNGRRDLPLAVGIAAGASWIVVEALAGRAYSSGWILAWNGAIRLAVFVLIGALVASRARSRSFEAQLTAAAGGPSDPCPYCGSSDTLRLSQTLVCRSCRRLADREGTGGT